MGIHSPSGSLRIGDVASLKGGGGGRKRLCGWMWGRKGEPAFSWMSGEEKKKTSRTQVAKNKANKGSSFLYKPCRHRANSSAWSCPWVWSPELPSALSPCLPAPPALISTLLSAPLDPPRATKVHSAALSPAKGTRKSLVLFGGLLLLP